MQKCSFSNILPIRQSLMHILNKRCIVLTTTTTVHANSWHFCALNSSLNKCNLLNPLFENVHRQHRSFSSTLDSVKNDFWKSVNSNVDINNEVDKQPQLVELKELSIAAVERSPTRHISEQQFSKAQKLCDTYYNSDPILRFHYLLFLATDFATNFEYANHSANSYLSTQKRNEPFDPILLVDRLRNQIRPRYLELFRLASRLDNGVKFLVDLRSDLVTVLNSGNLINTQNPSAKVALRLMSGELSDLLSLWFSAGFLRLERVTWDSPTSILQKISEYEAVHPIKNWLDLKHRVGLYRRCYMFSHSCLPGEPLVILHVALVNGISTSIQDIIMKSTQHSANSNQSVSDGAFFTLSTPLAKSDCKVLNSSAFSRQTPYQYEDPKQISAAIFYSISSTQKGLNGIDLGHQMIMQVASALRGDFSSMQKYSSLSPIPNFTEYLLSTIHAIQRNDDAKNFLSIWTKHTDLPRLMSYVDSNEKYASMVESVSDTARGETHLFWSRLVSILRSGKWVKDPVLVQLLEQPLMRTCAYYLFHEKRRGYALNSVANFHLKNGAVMWRLNWLADTSSRGLTSSCGVMINYRYYLEQLQDNSQTYLNERKIIAGEQFLKWI